MFSMFKKKVSKSVDQIKKFERKDLAEAAIGAGVLIASVEGGVSDEEVLTIMGLVQNMDQFKHHQNEIEAMIGKYTSLLKAGFLVGKINIMREIADVKGNDEEIEDVLAIAVTIAGSDGDFSQKEADLLKEIANKLGFPPSKLASFGVPM